MESCSKTLHVRHPPIFKMTPSAIPARRRSWKSRLGTPAAFAVPCRAGFETNGASFEIYLAGAQSEQLADTLTMGAAHFNQGAGPEFRTRLKELGILGVFEEPPAGVDFRDLWRIRRA